jgi:chromatin remodeling complex protein RSC6
MVRAAKTEKPTATTPATTAPVASDAAASAPVKKEKKAKKAAPVETPAAAPVVEAAPTNEVVVDVDASSLAAKMTEFSAKLQQLNSIFSAVKGDFKTLEKAVSRELKAAQKSSGKKTKRAGNRAPSGFVKPTLISDELAAFLGKSKGTELARTAVSKEINAYIRNNQLQDKTNGRIIVPDAKLAALLKTTPADQLTYFNLQRYMKHHFVKSEAPASA